MSTSATTARLIKWSAAPAALALAGALLWQSSYSAFSDTTQNASNNWSAGTVKLADDDTGSAEFNVADMAPGSTGSHCIAVTSTGSLPVKVVLYSANETTTKALDGQIQLTVTQGTGGSFGNCAGFQADGTGSNVYTGTLADFGTKTAYATGAGSWATKGGGAAEVKTYKINYTLSPNAGDAYQGGSAAVDFVWEAQNS